MNVLIFVFVVAFGAAFEVSRHYALAAARRRSRGANSADLSSCTTVIRNKGETRHEPL